MKRFPLEPLSRVRELRLEAAQRVVAERRAEVRQAEQQRDLALQARGEAVGRRARHQQEVHAALSDPARLDRDWLERADRHRHWLDGEIVRASSNVAAAEAAVAKAQARLDEELAELRRVQAKFDALQTFRGEWKRGQMREQEQREERDSEELFRAPPASAR